MSSNEATTVRPQLLRCVGQHIWRSRFECLAALSTLAIVVAELRYQGRRWWCACGGLEIWWSDTNSSHNSQHLLDPYSLTHVLHGLLFYGLLTLLMRRSRVSCRFVFALAIEGLWELFENSTFVIERYRAATISLNYYGDSIVNSLGDIACCTLGFWLTPRLGFSGSVALFLAIEAILLFWIHDDLLLNILMLVYPIDAVKAWQIGR